MDQLSYRSSDDEFVDDEVVDNDDNDEDYEDEEDDEDIELFPNVAQNPSSLLCPNNRQLFFTLMSTIGLVGFLSSPAGGLLKEKAIKGYVSRLQHFAAFSEVEIRFEDGVTSQAQFLSLMDTLVQSLEVLLPNYAASLCTLYGLLPSSVCSCLTKINTVCRWYILFGGKLHSFSTSTRSLLIAQLSQLISGLRKQYTRVNRKRKQTEKSDSIQFKVPFYNHCFI